MPGQVTPTTSWALTPHSGNQAESSGLQKSDGSHPGLQELIVPPYLVMRPGPTGFDKWGQFQRSRGPMIEQANLELLQTHSTIPILVQLVEQVFKFLKKSALGIGSEAAPKQP